MTKQIRQQHLGVIEGFYGKPWGFEKRHALIPFLLARQYSFFIYAPKADSFFRENWRAPLPEPLFARLRQLGGDLRKAGMDWGIGLSPYELHLGFDQKGKDDLKRRIGEMHEAGCNWLAILFDDMKGDLPNLADIQIEICEFVKENSDFEKLLMCPSYYCFDPILEKVFGSRPDNYLEDLGKHLDKEIEIFWTGEEVCSPAYSKEHLTEVAGLLNRKPFIWDNYPVNDGARMSPFLHMSAFTGREFCVDGYAGGIAVNPMNEAFLSTIPMATLSDCLANPESYSAEDSFRKWLRELAGKAGEAILEDLESFEKEGLDGMGENEKQALIEKYQQVMDSANEGLVNELLEFLRGEYRFDLSSDEVPTQSLWSD